jgi:predicted metal-dependent hydrolase
VQLRLPWTTPTPTPATRSTARALRPRAIEIAGRVFPVQVARHPWARRYVLRVTPAGMVRLTVPRSASIAGGLAFAEGEAAWIAAEWARLDARSTWRAGTCVWHQGALVVLSRDGRDVCCGDQRIAGAAQDDWRAAIERHWRRQAAEILPARCFALAAQHGLRPVTVRVRNQRSRWGACSARGTITLNWRLVQMPPEVADYVMLHELAHLRQPNHSRRFWREVGSLCPGWQAAERWLKAFGRELL